MKMNDRIQVTGMRLLGFEDIGAAAAKAMPAMNRYRYTQAVVYTLADGREVGGTLRGLTKPKLGERIASRRRSIECGSFSAVLDEAGRMIGGQTTTSLR